MVAAPQGIKAERDYVVTRKIRIRQIGMPKKGTVWSLASADVRRAIVPADEGEGTDTGQTVSG